ncbi:MAG: hypothetical protein ABJH04_07610 [Cyclobacteriaceae bacterium]
MKKATFVLLAQKKDAQIQHDISLTGQQRVERMFDLIEFYISLQKEYVRPTRPNEIVLTRINCSTYLI